MFVDVYVKVLPFRSVVVTMGIDELVPVGCMLVDVYVKVFPLRSVAVITRFEELVVWPWEGVYVCVLPFESVYVIVPTDDELPVGLPVYEVPVLVGVWVDGLPEASVVVTGDTVGPPLG